MKEIFYQFYNIVCSMHVYQVTVHKLVQHYALLTRSSY